MFGEIKQAVLRRISVRRNVSVGAGFHVGPGSVLWAPRTLELGRDVYVGKNVTIEVDGVVGDGVMFANLSGVVGRTDHDQTDLGKSIRRSQWVGDAPNALSRPVLIGSDVWVGYGAIILSGVTVGDSVIIGAGAVVTRDIPSNSVAVGNPARVVGIRFGDEDLVVHWRELEASGHRILVGSSVTTK